MSDHQNGLHLEAENWPRALFAVALAFSVFQVVTAAFPLISTQVLRAMHVGLLLLVVYISYPAFGIRRPWQPLAWLLGMAGLGTAVYQWVFEADLIQRSGELTQADMVVGVVLIVLVFEAARRVMGIALPIICALFLPMACSANTCRATWPTAATASTRSSTSCRSVPKVSTARRPTCRQPTSICSSCSAPSSSRPA